MAKDSNSGSTANTAASFPFVVAVFIRHNDHDEQFLGTATAVHARGVLTCRHVAASPAPAGEPAELRPGLTIKTTDGREFPVIDGAIAKEVDLAFLELVEGASLESVAIAGPLTKDFGDNLDEVDWVVQGYPESSHGRKQSTFRDLNSRLPKYSEGGKLEAVQVSGGIDDGCSGSPALCTINGKMYCFAIAYHGGEPAAASRLICRDSILDSKIIKADFIDWSGAPGLKRLQKRPKRVTWTDRINRTALAIAAVCLVVLALAFTFLRPKSAWEEFEKPSGTRPWKDVIKGYRKDPPEIESRIMYDEAKARALALGDKEYFYPAIAAAEVALRKKPSDFQLQAKVGEYFTALGDYGAARTAKKQAIAQLEKLKLDRPNFANEAAILYFQLGNVNERDREKEQALQAYAQAEAFASESGNKKVLDDIAAKVASFDTAEDKIEYARVAFQRATDNFGRFSAETATRANNLALAYFKAGKHENARRTFNEVITILENVKGSGGTELAMACINLGMVCEEVEDYKSADDALSRATEILGPNQNIMGFNALFNFAKHAIEKGRKVRADVWYGRAKGYLEQVGGLSESDIERDKRDLAELRKRIDEWNQPSGLPTTNR